MSLLSQLSFQVKASLRSGEYQLRQYHQIRIGMRTKNPLYLLGSQTAISKSTYRAPNRLFQHG